MDCSAPACSAAGSGEQDDYPGFAAPCSPLPAPARRIRSPSPRGTLIGDPRRLRPDEVEILIARELRKAGLEVSGLKTRARTSLSKGGDDYAVELTGLLRVDDADRRVLIECRNERQRVGPDAVRALHDKLLRGEDDAPRSLMRPQAARPPMAQHALMFSTSGYEPDAARAARAHGIALLTVADGKTAFARSPWGMAGQPPAWVPEYMAEMVDLDATGQLRHELIVSGQSERILGRLREAGRGTRDAGDGSLPSAIE